MTRHYAIKAIEHLVFLAILAFLGVLVGLKASHDHSASWVWIDCILAFFDFALVWAHLRKFFAALRNEDT